MTIRRAALCLSALALLATAPVAPAVAQSPTEAVYGTDIPPAPVPPPAPPATERDSGPAPAAAEEPSGLEAQVGALPFTGLDLLVLAGIALALAGTGLALRRARWSR